MKHLLQSEFGFKRVEVEKLSGYVNINYLVKTNSSKYIFKTYSPDNEMQSLVEIENETLIFLHKAYQNKFPKPVPFIDGSYVKTLEIDGKETICRMLSGSK